MMALGQLDGIHRGPGLQCQCSWNKAAAACLLQPSFRNHTAPFTSFFWLRPNQKPAQVQGEGTETILLQGGVSVTSCTRECRMCTLTRMIITPLSAWSPQAAVFSRSHILSALAATAQLTFWTYPNRKANFWKRGPQASLWQKATLEHCANSSDYQVHDALPLFVGSKRISSSLLGL